jgi:hypothetical protein
LNPESYIAYAERETWNVSAVFGEKVSPDGNLLFSPLLNDIDVIDAKRGNLLTRISLSVALSPNYDALVSDGQDNVLIAITGQTGSGIAVIDLTAVPEPPSVPWTTNAVKPPVHRPLASSLPAKQIPKLDSHGPRIKHTTNQAVLVRHQTEPRQ